MRMRGTAKLAESRRHLRPHARCGQKRGRTTSPFSVDELIDAGTNTLCLRNDETLVFALQGEIGSMAAVSRKLERKIDA
jgi:hypothetical protein